MNTDYGFSNNLLNKYDFGGYSTGMFNYASASYSKTENADITIVTDDGDRVTISTDTGMESGYTSYSGLLRSGSSSARAEGYDYQSRMHSNFSMSISGDLDSQEYEDIISALKTIDSVMEGISSGNMVDLQAIAEEFGGLESLSGLTASIQVQESMSYEQVQSAVAGVNEPAVDNESNNQTNTEKLDDALSGILNSGKKHGKSHGKMRQLMDGYLSALLDSFSGKSSEKHHNLEAGKLLKNMIMNRLSESPEAAESIVDKTKSEVF